MPVKYTNLACLNLEIRLLENTLIKRGEGESKSLILTESICFVIFELIVSFNEN